MTEAIDSTVPLTPEEQRVLIAQACGWTVDEDFKGFFGNRGSFIEPVPDYLNDLNAAIQLCDVLAKQGWNCGLDNGLDTTWECTFHKPATPETHPDKLGGIAGELTESNYAANANLASAISECFLRALGKWRGA